MIRTFFAFILALVLSGCTGELLDSANKTGGEVAKTNDQLFDLRQLQTLGGALEIMSSPEKSPNIRVRAAKVVILRAPDSSVGEHLATPAPLAVKSISTSVGDVPNVSIVFADEKVPSTHAPKSIKVGSKAVVPQNKDLYDVLQVASAQLVEQLNLKSQQPDISEADMNQLKLDAKRAGQAFAAVQGAIVFTSTTRVSALKDLTSVQESANSMMSLANRILTKDEVTELKATFATKLPGIKTE